MLVCFLFIVVCLPTIFSAIEQRQPGSATAQITMGNSISFPLAVPGVLTMSIQSSGGVFNMQLFSQTQKSGLDGGQPQAGLVDKASLTTYQYTHMPLNNNPNLTPATTFSGTMHLIITNPSSASISVTYTVTYVPFPTAPPSNAFVLAIPGASGTFSLSTFPFSWSYVTIPSSGTLTVTKSCVTPTSTSCATDGVLLNAKDLMQLMSNGEYGFRQDLTVGNAPGVYSFTITTNANQKAPPLYAAFHFPANGGGSIAQMDFSFSGGGAQPAPSPPSQPAPTPPPLPPTPLPTMMSRFGAGTLPSIPTTNPVVVFPTPVPSGVVPTPPIGGIPTPQPGVAPTPIANNGPTCALAASQQCADECGEKTVTVCKCNADGSFAMAQCQTADLMTSTGGLSVVAIIAIAVGGLAFCLIVVCIVFFCLADSDDDDFYDDTNMGTQTPMHGSWDVDI